MNSKKYHHGDLKLATKKMALDLILKNHNFEFSMRDISKALKVSHTAPYKHFKTKEELLAEIAMDGFESLTLELKKNLSKKINKNLLLLIAEIYINFGMKNPIQYKLMFGGVIKNLENYPDVFQKSKESYNTFKKLINKLIEAKIVKKSNVNHLTFYAWSLLHGFVTLMEDHKFIIAYEDIRKVSISNFMIFFFKGISVAREKKTS